MSIHEITQLAQINEIALLGSVMMNGSNAARLVANLKEDHFLSDHTKLFFSLVQRSITHKELLRNLVAENGLAGFAANAIDRAFMLDSDFEKAMKKQREYWMIYKSTQILISTTIEKPEEDIARLIQEMHSILESSESEECDPDALLDLYEKAQYEQAKKIEEGKPLLGYSCGISKIDEIIDGIRKEHFWVVGGYSSTGKTFFALNIATALLEQNAKVGIYSLEMSKQDLVGRILGIKSQIPSIRILKGILTDDEHRKIREAKDLIREKLFIHSEKNSIDEIITSMRLAQLKYGIDVFILDYAQLVQDGKSSEYDTLRKVSTELQHFCRQNKVSIIMLSQVSNESAKNPNGFVMGFKGSGAIGASADLAIELQPNESKEDRIRKIREKLPFAILASAKKNRHGPVRDIELEFTSSCGKFTEISDGF